MYWWIGIISIGVFIISIGIMLLLAWRDHKKTGRPYSCCLGFHNLDKQAFNGVTFKAKCKKCGAILIQDGHGNWFEVDKE